MTKNTPAFAIAKSDLDKLTRSEQRRFVDLGMVVDTKTEAKAVTVQAEGKAK